MGKLGVALRAFFRVFKDGDFAKFVVNEHVVEKPRTDASVCPKEVLQLLSLLQEEGRLIDFLQEDISGFSDDQIGAAVRNIHANCRKVVRDLFEICPVVEGREGEQTTLASDFDTNAIKLVGKVCGNPPFAGIIRHHGWKIARTKLQAAAKTTSIIAQAEIEIS